MTDTNIHDIHLDLADPRELFHPAELDPIGGQPYAEPGLERILNRIRPRPDRPVRATLRLPAAARTPDLEARMRSGLQQYCDHRIGQIANDIASLRQEGLATLWRGLLFLALCMLGSQILGEPKFLPGILARFLDEGLIIAGLGRAVVPARCAALPALAAQARAAAVRALRDMDLKLEFAD